MDDAGMTPEEVKNYQAAVGAVVMWLGAWVWSGLVLHELAHWIRRKIGWEKEN